jgi:WD40 repeat protein
LQGGHSRGILSARWNPHDPRFLVTSGDDGISSFWTSEGYLLHQISHDGVPFEFEWNPQVPGMFATSLYNGKLQVKNVHFVGHHIVPNWIGERTGASFGFGGKLSTFTADQPGVVTTSNIVSEVEFVDLFHSFQETLNLRGPEQICEDKVCTLLFVSF